MDAAARAESTKVSQFAGNVLGWEQEVEIFNSEGVQVSDRRHYNRIMAQTIAALGSEQSVGYEAPGAMMGWEHAAGVDPRELALTATRQALVKLGAAPARAASCRSSWRAALAASSSTRRAATCWRPPRWPRRPRCSTTRWASSSPIRRSARWTRGCRATPGLHQRR